MSAPQPQSVPAGWYPEGTNGQRYWDGTAWTEHRAPLVPQAAPPVAPRTANGMPVSYVRPQQGHSLVKWLIASLLLVLPVIGLIYYSVSPNHYWHA
jgi:hypothetical protein